jgi:hypothetical protein
MRIATVIVAGALVVPLGGCGDDDGDRLDRGAFVEQANAICEEEGRVVEDAGDEVFTSEEPDPETVRTFLEDVAIPRVQSMVDRIDELEPPEDVEEDVDRLVELTNGAVDEMRTAAESDDPLSLFADGDPFAEADALALELGLGGCSDDDDAGGDGEG